MLASATCRRFSRAEEVISAVSSGESSATTLVLPDLASVHFLGTNGWTLLAVLGVVICTLGLAFGLAQFVSLRNMPVHRSMREISELIYETCKTYLTTQIRFIFILELFIGSIMVVYFKFLAVDHEGAHMSVLKVATIILFSLVARGF